MDKDERIRALEHALLEVLACKDASYILRKYDRCGISTWDEADTADAKALVNARAVLNQKGENDAR